MDPTTLATRARERSLAMPPSALHSIHRLVEAKGDDVIALHVGEAHMPIPQAARDAFCRAIRDGRSTYCDAPGLPALREALCARVGEATGEPPPIEHMFVTPGSCQAICAVLLSVAADGGVALLPEIHWPTHLQQVLMAGLTPRFYSMREDGPGVAASLEANYDRDVSVVVVNSPSNPAGQVLSTRSIEEIYEWARRRGVWIISDEAYEDFVFEGAPSAMGRLDAANRPRDRLVFGVRTFSKAYSMTGYRLGYVSAPNAARAELLLRVQEASLVAPCAPVQYAGLAALADNVHVAAHRRYVKETRDCVLSRLEGRNLVWARPSGGWYLLLDLSAYAADADALHIAMLEDGGVAVAPGRSFAPPGHATAPRLARLAFCRERQYTLRGVDRLLAFLSAQKL